MTSTYDFGVEQLNIEGQFVATRFTTSLCHSKNRAMILMQHVRPIFLLFPASHIPVRFTQPYELLETVGQIASVYQGAIRFNQLPRPGCEDT